LSFSEIKGYRISEWLETQALTDTAAAAEDGDFLGIGFSIFGGSEPTREAFLINEGYVSGFSINLATNNFDAMSVNTLTLNISASSTSQVITIESTDGTGNFVLRNFHERIPAITGRFVLLWNSDSVASSNLRSISFVGGFNWLLKNHMILAHVLLT